MNRKKEYLVSSILFAVGTVIWIISVYMNYHSRSAFDILSVLQCCCAVLFSAAAIAYFIRYRRGDRNQDGK